VYYQLTALDFTKLDVYSLLNVPGEVNLQVTKIVDVDVNGCYGGYHDADVLNAKVYDSLVAGVGVIDGNYECVAVLFDDGGLRYIFDGFVVMGISCKKAR